ncbi:MAG: hypothetical protein ACRYFV_08440 [Janthinobacterium lividum]
MKTAGNNPSVSSTSTGAHWSWWLFLLGVLACSAAGPSCAWH